MNQIPWYITAVGAAVVWGVHYPLIDNALKKVSLFSVLLFTAVPIVALTPFFYRTLLSDYQSLAALDWNARLPVLALGLTSLCATALLFVSIGNKNATLSSLVEITYPLFVAVFAFTLFREIQLSPQLLVGALFVFLGVGIIVAYSH